jgi:hypothetical protein
MNNKNLVGLHFSRLAILAFAFLMLTAASTSLWAQADSHGEEFFMISSVDQQNHQVVLMRPTQLTVVADLGAQTLYLGDKGQKLTSKDLRAGDTVWAVIKPGKNGAENAVRIREGAMTQAELQKLYLHYTTSTPTTPPVAPKPLTPAPESGSAQPQPPSIPNAAPATSVPSNATLQRSHKPGHSTHHPQGATGAV